MRVLFYSKLHLNKRSNLTILAHLTVQTLDVASLVIGRSAPSRTVTKTEPSTEPDFFNHSWQRNVFNLAGILELQVTIDKVLGLFQYTTWGQLPFLSAFPVSFIAESLRFLFFLEQGWAFRITVVSRG